MIYLEALQGVPTELYEAGEVGTSTNWAHLAAASKYTLAIRSDGTLWAWGRNLYGNLGIGNTTDQYDPVQVRF